MTSGLKCSARKGRESCANASGSRPAAARVRTRRAFGRGVSDDVDSRNQSAMQLPRWGVAMVVSEATRMLAGLRHEIM